jgi:hypothetical protein
LGRYAHLIKIPRLADASGGYFLSLDVFENSSLDTRH